MLLINLSMWYIVLALGIFVTIIGVTSYIICRDMWKNQFTQEAQANEEWWKRQKDNMDKDLRDADKKFK
jgi:hypothetical protein